MNIDYLQPIYDLLSTDSDILSIIGQPENIYFNDFPADASGSIAIYEISDTPIGNSKLNNKRIQLNLYHTDKYKCAKLSEYTRNILHTFQGLQTGVVFTSIYNVQTSGMIKTETGEYIIVQDYIVQY